MHIEAVAHNTKASLSESLQKKHVNYPRPMQGSNHRQAAYDLMKLRGKKLVERIRNTRYYRIKSAGIRILAGLLTLHEKVKIKIKVPASPYRLRRAECCCWLFVTGLSFKNLTGWKGL